MMGHHHCRRAHVPFFTLALCSVLLAPVSPAPAQDCNNNGIIDACDIDCGTPGGPCDVPGCGTKPDCNTNGVPDGCELNQPDVTLLFDGIDDIVALPMNLLPWLTSETTVEIWFQTSGSGVIFGQQVATPFGSPGGHVPVLYVGLDGKLRAEYWWGSMATLTSAGPVNDNQWHHAAISYDLKTFRLFLDGVEISQKTTGLVNYSNTLNYYSDTEHLDMCIFFTHSAA